MIWTFDSGESSSLLVRGTGIAGSCECSLDNPGVSMNVWWLRRAIRVERTRERDRENSHHSDHLCSVAAGTADDRNSTCGKTTLMCYTEGKDEYRMLAAH